MTTPDAAGARDRILVVPVGSTEQHGPHLPLTTDTDIAVALADGLARRSTGVRVAPAIPYGSSGEHQSFAGTLSIGADATELLLVELSRSATETWPRVLFVSTHGGNAETVARAVARLQSEGRDIRSWSPDWSGDAHAGHSETSLMLAIDAARVDAAQIQSAVGATEPIDELIDAMRAGGVAAVSPNGVLGDPRTADRAQGEAMLDDAITALAAFVEQWNAG